MIAEQDVKDIVSHVQQAGLSDGVIADLRAQYKDYHFTYCMDDDMDAHTPAIEGSDFNIYFVDSANHCAKLTRDPAQGSGFVFAEIVDDD